VSGVVRRVVLAGALRTTTNCITQIGLRRGPVPPAGNTAWITGAQDILAGLLLAQGSAGSTHNVVDVPLYVPVNIGEQWCVTLHTILGATAEDGFAAFIHYE
jgi:hypothetical protein